MQNIRLAIPFTKPHHSSLHQSISQYVYPPCILYSTLWTLWTYELRMCHRYIDCNTQYMSCGHTTGAVNIDVSCSSPSCTNSSAHHTPCQFGMSATCGTCNGQGFACGRHHTCRPVRQTSIRPRNIVWGYCPNHSNMWVLWYWKIPQSRPDGFGWDDWILNSAVFVLGVINRALSRHLIKFFFFFAGDKSHESGYGIKGHERYLSSNKVMKVNLFTDVLSDIVPTYDVRSPMLPCDLFMPWIQQQRWFVLKSCAYFQSSCRTSILEDVTLLRS